VDEIPIFGLTPACQERIPSVVNTVLVPSKFLNLDCENVRRGRSATCSLMTILLKGSVQRILTGVNTMLK
jgi:hypothetical protein